MSELYQKTEISGVYRDPSSGAFINQDIDALKGYKRRKESNRAVRNMNERLTRMESELDEMQKMMNQILQNLKESSDRQQL